MPGDVQDDLYTDDEELLRRGGGLGPDVAPVRNPDIVLGGRQFPNPDNLRPRSDEEGPEPTRTSTGSKLALIPPASEGRLDASNPAPAEVIPPTLQEASAGGNTPPKIASPSANDKTPPATLRGVAPNFSPDKQPTPEATALSSRRAADEAELHRLQTTGSGISQLPKPARIPLRILEGIGSALSAPVMSMIPGTTLHHNILERGARGRLNEDIGQQEKQATTEHLQSQAASLDRNDALNRALLTKGYTLGQDAQGNPVLTEIPGFERNKVGTTPEELTLHDLMAGDNGKPRINPDTKQPYTYPEAYEHLKELAQGTKPDTQEQNKRAFQAVVGKLDAAGLPTDVKHLDRSLDKALKNKTITAEEHATARSYQSANPTPGTNLEVHVAGAEAAEAIHRSDKLYAYADENGKTQWAFGNKIPPGAQVMYEVKSPEMAVKSARNMNIVQDSFGKLAKHPAEMFDDPATRSVITTSLDENKAHSIGILVAGTGGSLTMPSGAGKIIDQLLQNNAVPEKYRKEAKDFIVDYYGMKDKMIALQQNLQGGKIGRLTAPALEAMFSQLPGVTTADSNMFRRQVANLKSFIDDAREDIPESYGNFKRAPDLNLGGGGGNTVRVQIPGHPPGTISADKLKDFKAKYPDAQVLP